VLSVWKAFVERRSGLIEGSSQGECVVAGSAFIDSGFVPGQQTGLTSSFAKSCEQCSTPD
jgi:hypothetical protein